MKTNKNPFFLILFEAFRGFRITGTIWVVLLLSRGFSLVDIGIAEGVFHAVSFLFEVPSGMLADLLGRKKTLLISCLLASLSAFAMSYSSSLFGVCVSFALEALSFNLASGTLEALLYDSLKALGREEQYDKHSSKLLAAYSVMQAVSGLISYWVLKIGFFGAYLIAGLISLASFCTALYLTEPLLTQSEAVKTQKRTSFLRRLTAHVRETAGFLLLRRMLVARMLLCGIFSAVSYLLQMYWQQMLLDIGLPSSVLGPVLCLFLLADVLGALCMPYAPNRFGTLCAVTVLPGAVLCALAGVPLLIVSIPCAFLSGFLCTLFLSRADTLLQPFYPSEARATITSVDSMLYSICMIVLSPVSGQLAQRLGIPLALALLGAGVLILYGVILLRFFSVLNQKK